MIEPLKETMSYTQKEMQKSHKKPTKLCQYGKSCYRKNPIHFTEYAHEHLDSIYEKGIDSETNEYEIPKELCMHKETIEIQLKLLERLFPRVYQSYSEYNCVQKLLNEPKPIDQTLAHNIEESKTRKWSENSNSFYSEAFSKIRDSPILTPQINTDNYTSSQSRIGSRCRKNILHQQPEKRKIEETKTRKLSPKSKTFSAISDSTTFLPEMNTNNYPKSHSPTQYRCRKKLLDEPKLINQTVTRKIGETKTKKLSPKRNTFSSEAFSKFIDSVTFLPQMNTDHYPSSQSPRQYSCRKKLLDEPKSINLRNCKIGETKTKKLSPKRNTFSSDNVITINDSTTFLPQINTDNYSNSQSNTKFNSIIKNVDEPKLINQTVTRKIGEKLSPNRNIFSLETFSTINNSSTFLNASKKRSNASASTLNPACSSNDVNSVLLKKPKLNENIEDYIQVNLPKGQAAQKLKNAAPYNFFLTAITSSQQTHHEPLTITFQELLDDSLGKIESSVQINFMVDVGWLLGHYYFAECLDKPLLILYGDETLELLKISKHQPQVTAIKVKMSSPFATHHTKMMLFGYKDGSMRIVISTANLYADDWHNRTQGLWISPQLNLLPFGANTDDGESETGFRKDLMLYLVEYKLKELQPWIAKIRQTDFSSINVFFIASTPGGFQKSSTRGHPWGHARLGKILNDYSAKIDSNVPLIAQSSSIGSLGPSEQSWIQSNFINSLRKDTSPFGIRTIPKFKMIYPSYNNVRSSHDGLLGGGCLPYSKATNDKQPWLRHHLYQWISRTRHRNKAMPHIKTYCRYSDEGLYWFVLTSANLSKAAWGSFNKNNKIEPTLRIMNYEAGVVFLPKIIIKKDTFPLKTNRSEIPAFPMPYDIPLKSYTVDETPFVMDYLMKY